VKVTVKMGAPLSQVVGQPRVSLSLPPEATLADVLDEMQERYPEFQEGLKGKGLRKPFDRVLYSLFVNSRPVAWADAPDNRLQDGDRVHIFLPVAGGE
jgi:molybdopterin converting factor small subunit